MALLVGRDDTASFTETFITNFGTTVFHVNYTSTSSPSASPFTAGATGSADKLGLYINSWGTLNSIKCCLYDSSLNLIESVVVPSSVGTGSVLIDMAGTVTITNGNGYILGWYNEASDDAFVMYMDNGDAAFRLGYHNASGNYTTPVDPLGNLSWIESTNFAWWIESADSSGVPVLSDHLRMNND